MYFCFRCGKKNNSISNLNQHLRKKKQCKIIYLELPRNIIINNYNKYEKDFLILKNEEIENTTVQIENPIENPIVSNSEISDQDNEIKCEFCSKTFTFKTSYYRHKKMYCIKKNVYDKEKLMDEFLNTKYNLLKLEYEEKLKIESNKIEKIEEILGKEIDSNNKLKKELEEKVKELESKLCATSQINNGHIGNNIVNGDINNITIINNYGEEKFTMTAKDCEKIMSSEFDMIVKLIEYIHILPPENRNAFVPSLKEKYAMILRNQKWDLVDRTEFINNLVISKNVMLEKMLDEFGSQFEYVNPNRSRSIINYCKNDEEEYKKIKINANLLLFNNKDTIRNTFEVKYNKKIKYQ
jgi:hypothetical protein